MNFDREPHSAGWLQVVGASDVFVVELPGGVPLHFRSIQACQQGFLRGNRIGPFSKGETNSSLRFLERFSEPRHRFVVPEPFYLGVFPITRQQFDAWASTDAYGAWRESNPTHVDTEKTIREESERRAECCPMGMLFPATWVTWHEASAYCQWLMETRDFKRAVEAGLLPTAVVAGLPTEGQWEYACRGGMDTDYWNGDGEEALDQVGWYAANSGGRIHSVGHKLGNSFGLHDLHGNVWEWCSNLWDPASYRSFSASVSKTPAAPIDMRVVRGGSWSSDTLSCRSSFRYRFKDNQGGINRGFRVCLFASSMDPPGNSGSSLDLLSAV